MYDFSKLLTAHFSYLYDDVEKERGHTLDLVPYCLKQKLRGEKKINKTTRPAVEAEDECCIFFFFFTGAWPLL